MVQVNGDAAGPWCCPQQPSRTGSCPVIRARGGHESDGVSGRWRMAVLAIGVSRARRAVSVPRARRGTPGRFAAHTSGPGTAGAPPERADRPHRARSRGHGLWACGPAGMPRSWRDRGGHRLACVVVATGRCLRSVGWSVAYWIAPKPLDQVPQRPVEERLAVKFEGAGSHYAGAHRYRA